MANKRGNGEGSMYKMASGNWRAQISGPLGTRRSMVGRTKAECQQWLFERKSEQLKGINPLAGNVRLEDFISNWLLSISGSRSPRTIILYRSTLSPILKLLGSIPVNEIHPDQIQAAYNRMLTAGSSPYAVKRIHKVLHIAFAFGQKLRVIVRNPVSDATPPKHNSKKMTPLDASQVQTLLLGAQTIGDPYYALYYLAINTGMRQGELLGLHWNDVDWGKAEITVSRQLVRSTDGKYEFRDPKSESGFRRIAIGKDVLELLRNHKDQQLADGFRAAEARNQYDLVFPSQAGTPINNSNLRRSFRRLLELTNLPKVRFHDLRHTAATLMLESGIPVTTVSQRLGHSKTSMTLDVYAHSTPLKQIEAAERMEELMTPISFPVAHGLHTEVK